MEQRLASTPAWRRQPYKLFFPLGLALTWAGVLHWVLVAAGVLDGYRAVFHSIAQIQGFLMSFAIGFLFTAVPRRTQTAPPRAWQMVACAGSLAGAVIAAWFDAVALSQAFWFGAVVVLLAFIAARFRESRQQRRPPVSFVWIPVALAMGICGSALAGIGGIYEDELWELHELGRALLLQGMFLGLVLGVGGMVLPLITRGESVADLDHGRRGSALWHLSAALALAATFVLEHFGPATLARALRAALTALALVAGCRAHRPPTRAGSHRWLVWASVWFLPAGYALAAAMPSQPQVGLHAMFIGGFAMLTLSVGLHVTLAHGGRQDLVFGRPWQVTAYGALIAVAVVARAISHFDSGRRLEWLGAAGAAFLLATVAWALLAWKGARDQAPTGEPS